MKTKANPTAGRGFTLLLTFVMNVGFARAFASEASMSAQMDAYLRPYVATQNFSGSVLVAQDGKTIFDKSYGWSDMERKQRNTPRTQFHVASMSMQFTAAAIMRLVDAGKVALDASVSDIIPTLPNSDRITVRHLLTQTSGMADINDLNDYPQILAAHQTPDTLMQRMLGVRALREPGGAYVREEHTAYNLLALIVERKTGMPFAAAVRRLVFAPLQMADSGIDDDSTRGGAMAKGYEPLGIFRLQPARAIHWSGKTGNGSAYTTVRDEQKWLDGLFNTAFLSEKARATMFDISARVGYGWFKAENPHYGAVVYSMNGRAPGFAAAMMYFPKRRLAVIVLGNIYASSTTRIANDLAALALAMPVDNPQIGTALPPGIDLEAMQGAFVFGADFYQPNATLRLGSTREGLTLTWPNGDISALIPTGPDRFVDRAYWVPVELKRDGQGRVAQILYDRFQGQAALTRP